MIQIHQTACIGCGLCVRDCTTGALTLAGKTARFSLPENCIDCGHCIAICPQNAVTDDALPMDDVAPVEAPLSPDQLLGQMRSRRSCRQFLDKPVSDEALHMLLEAARACPTAKNLQATRYIVVTEHQKALLQSALEALGAIGIAQRDTATDPSERRRAENFIRWAEESHADSDFDPLFYHAPMLLLFVSDAEGVADAAAQAAYAELMAHSLGLGCLYSGYFTACCGFSETIQQQLALGPQERVARCLVLGYPAVSYRRTAPRKAVALTKM